MSDQSGSPKVEGAKPAPKPKPQKLGTYKSMEVLRAFKIMGWKHPRTKGDHHMMVSPDGRTRFPLTVKRGKDMNAGYIQKVLRDAGIPIEEFRRYL